MRITSKMLSNSFINDMNTNMKNMQQVQEQMTSGKEIRRPSDDPFKVARSMELNTSINANKQYNSNIKDTINWMDTTDTTLGQAGDVLQRVNELLVSAGNAAYGSDERQAIKDEINQRIGELGQILNTNFDGQYIFGGTRSSSKPVVSQTDTTTGNMVLGYSNADGTMINLNSTDPAVVQEGKNQINMINSGRQTEISQGVTIQYNVTAGDVLEFKNEKGDSIKLMDLLNKITNHLDGKSDDGTTLDADATNKLSNEDEAAITDAVNNLLKVRSEVGAKQNRMESAQTKNEDENDNMTEILSKTEDVDITEKTMEFANMQNVYMASLQTGAKIIQPTLLDYMR